MEWVHELIIGAVIAGTIVTWLKGLLNQLVPSPARAWLALQNYCSNRTQRAEEGFRLVLCWLENDDSGHNTKTVAQAFVRVEGITLLRSARIVSAKGASNEWRPAMKKRARAILEQRDADLAVIGLVKKSGEVLSVWFVPRSSEGTLDRGDQPYTLENVTLGKDFHDDLRVQLTAVALISLAPLADGEVRGQVIKKGLHNATTKLFSLVQSRTIGAGKHKAALQLVLGSALTTLGEREGSSERLEQAVDAFRAALDEFTRDRTSLLWAVTLNGLGIALRALGERESGTERLEEATAAYRAVLEERTRERVPGVWATTQNNLGNALAALGERMGGTEHLEQAVSAFRAALEEYTRERDPLNWATTQNNLGTALAVLGERETGAERLQQALQAFQVSLMEFTRERVPLLWAMTQHNIGNARRALGERERETNHLMRAVDAYRAALMEYSRERVPLLWAMTKHNLAVALIALESATMKRGTLRRRWIPCMPHLRNALVNACPPRGQLRKTSSVRHFTR